MTIAIRLGVLANFLPRPFMLLRSGVGKMRLKTWVRKAGTPRFSNGL